MVSSQAVSLFLASFLLLFSTESWLTARLAALLSSQTDHCGCGGDLLSPFTASWQVQGLSLAELSGPQTLGPSSVSCLPSSLSFPLQISSQVLDGKTLHHSIQGPQELVADGCYSSQSLLHIKNIPCTELPSLWTLPSVATEDFVF